MPSIDKYQREAVAKILTRLGEEWLQWWTRGDRERHLILGNSGAQETRAEPASEEPPTLDQIQKLHPAMTGREQIERALNGMAADEGHILREVIYVTPPREERSVICFIGLDWNFAANPEEFSIYLNIFGEPGARDEPVWHRGYRFETPNADKPHDYYHVQPIKTLGRGKVRIHGADGNATDKYPTIPVPASNIVTLCACVVASLYGTSKLEKVQGWLTGNRYQEDVKNLIRSVRQ